MAYFRYDISFVFCSILGIDSLYGVVIGIQPLQRAYSHLSKVMSRGVYLPEGSLYIIVN